jgi:hypothetical protein
MPSPEPEPEPQPMTERLLDAQREREALERERAVEALDDNETSEHQRRSEKAGYLREKLQEQIESDRDEQP